MTVPDKRVNLDYETFSIVNLKDVGAHRYAMDRSTEVLCLGWSIDRNDPILWIPGMPFPKDLRDAIRSGRPVYAWNTGFEYSIWKYVCMPKLNWPEIPLQQWRDTQAIALSLSLPASLEQCALVLGTVFQKDKRGEELIKLLSVPQRVTKNQSLSRFTRETHPHLFEEMGDYCLQDVRTEGEILDAMPFDLPSQELKTFHITMLKNDRGIPIDIDLVNSVVEVIDEYIEDVTSIVPIITNGAVEKVTQTKRIKEFCEAEGFEIPDLTKDTIIDLLEDPEIEKFPRVKSILELRQVAGKSSVSKFKKIQEAICDDNRIRDCLKYHKAGTGREGGRLLQPQNLPRAEVDWDTSALDKEAAFLEAVNRVIDDFKSLPLEDLMDNYDNILYTSSALIRPSVYAEMSDPNNTFLVSDYSQIENRMLCWLAGQQDILDLIEAGMCAYTDMAAYLYNQKYEDIPKSSRRRRHGKLTILGGGYGMGHKKFWEDCVHKQKFELTIEEAKKTIDAFRQKYDAVVDLWYGLQDAAIEACINVGNITSYGKISFMHYEGFLFMILPNGKAIAYPEARVEERIAPWGALVNNVVHSGIHPKTKQWATIGLTPGRLAENASQGASREILMEAVIDIEEQLEVPVILTVHDEAVVEVKKNQLSIEDLNTVLCNRSDVWSGLPLKAAGFESVRYHK